VQSFFKDVYKRDSTLSDNGAFFNWQFGVAEAARAAGHSCKLAMIDGKIIASLGYIPVEVSVGRQRVRGAWTANWAVHEHYRGLGAGPLLMRELVRQFEVTLVVGVSGEARSLLPRMGFTDYGDLARYTKVLNPEAAAALTEDGRPLDAPGVVAVPASRDRRVSIGSVQRFGDDVTALWDSLNGSSGAGTRRSAAFLNWRYAEHPVFDYRRFEARSGGQLVGVGIYRVEAVKGKALNVGRLVEWLVMPPAGGPLIDAVLEDARMHGVVFVDFFCSRTDVDALTESEFVRAGENTAALPILFQPIDHRRKGIPFMAHVGKLPDSPRVHQWYVTKGDGDQDRPN